MSEMQKAIIYKEPGKFAYEERPIPQIKNRNDVKIKSYGCAVCGTDVNIFAVPQRHPCKEGIIFGHEFCGEVVEVGEGVTNLKPGDKVVIDPHGPCGECENCLAGLPEACKNIVSRGVFGDGGLTKYLIMSKQFCYKVDPATKPEYMGVAEPLAGCGCALEKLNVHVGDTAAVLGAGPIGLMFIALLKANGCRKIIVSEPIAKRRELALEVGATRVVNLDEEDVVAAVMEETDGLGCDVAVEAVASMMAECVPLVRPHGKILQFGHDELARPPFPVAELLKNEIEVYGGYLGKYYMRKVAQIIESGILPLDKIVTDVIPASKYQEALDLASSKQCGKIFVSVDF